MHGSWALLATAVVLTAGATISVGSLCFFLTMDGARGLSLAAAYAAPGLAYMGVTYPAGDMTLLATLWRQMLPISHYIEIQMAQANSATPLHTALPQLTALAIFLLLLLFPMAKAHHLATTARPQPA
jgi:ABC-2 type transport system permease protein